MRLRVGARTDTGRVRALNEDVYVSRPERGLFVVCDGMGGAPAGEVASQVAVETILEQLDAADEEAAVEAGADGCSYLPRTNRLAQAVRRSNQVIYDQGRNDPRQAEMGTTVVGAWVTQHIASVAHVGDSRAYLLHDNHLEQLTRDHSLVEAEVRAGLMDREQSLQADHQNILLKVLGGAPDVEVELNEVLLHPGDYLLLCSDGLTRMVPERILTQAIGELQNPQRICDYLIDAANRNGGADNITVIVVEVVDRWWRPIPRSLASQNRAQCGLRGWFKPKMAVAITRNRQGYVATLLGGYMLIKGQSVRGRHELKDGDVLEVCGLVLEFSSLKRLTAVSADAPRL